jgi:hypothetical protein
MKLLIAAVLLFVDVLAVIGSFSGHRPALGLLLIVVGIALFFAALVQAAKALGRNGGI